MLSLIYGGLSSTGPIPGWVCILTGILYICYHLFDLLDGKHARNTKNSSPLGLLVDHGCDALTTFLFLMSMANILGLGIIILFNNIKISFIKILNYSILHFLLISFYI